MSRARKNFFWGKKKPRVEAPTLPFAQAKERAKEMSALFPLTSDQGHYLIKMPRLSGSGSVWYFLPSTSDRSFMRASPSSYPRSKFSSQSPWRVVLGNLREYRTPERHSVVLIDTFARKVSGPFGISEIEDFVRGARPNPRRRVTRRTRARKNWAVVAQVGAAMAIEIGKQIGETTWNRVKAMPIDERAAWLEEKAGQASWIGGPAGRAAYRIGRRFGPDSKGFWRSVAVAMDDPAVQRSVVKAAKTAAKAKKNPYWGVVDDNGRPVKEMVYSGPGRSSWDQAVFRTEGDFAVGEEIRMVEPFGVESVYEVLEASTGKLSRNKGKVRRKRGRRRG